MTDPKIIEVLFQKFKIKKEDMPAYRDADDFTSRIKICSVLKEEEIGFSNSSQSNALASSHAA